MLAAGLLTGLLYLVAAQLAFNAGLILPVVTPIVTLIFAVLGAVAAQGSLALIERARTRATFARFVPEPVVDRVLAQAGGELRLGGERRECTVLFSDIRGFTAYSEGRDPAEVIEILNRYLTEMTEAIMGHGGTLVSYIGDGIMAVFGAPLDQPDHADRALAAAREMTGPRLERFNAWLRDAGGGQGFRMGVGLNTGPVMSGNVGSEQRMEYTAIGDTVNSAARLEGATKDTPYQVLLADSTRGLLRGKAGGVERHGEVSVKGRSEAIVVWGVTDGAAAPAAHPAPVLADTAARVTT
ncbi:MAG TPA: adenylate/guanylate cyclase domain-containing protein [Solirubrobacteraceae bacterium]